MMFILYWTLELKPVDNSIRLLFMNYEIQNPTALIWASHIILIYFAWRFHLNSRRRIRSGYMAGFDTQPLNTKSKLYKKLKIQAETNYNENYKLKFEEERNQSAEKQHISDFSNLTYRINPISLKYESGNLTLTYQVQYDGARVFGCEFNNYTIRYKWFNFLLYKILKIISFTLKKEESPDFLLPWLMFFMAITTSILRHYGIDISYFKP